jgi:hypothetical protein
MDKYSYLNEYSVGEFRNAQSGRSPASTIQGDVNVQDSS